MNIPKKEDIYSPLVNFIQGCNLKLKSSSKHDKFSYTREENCATYISKKIERVTMIKSVIFLLLRISSNRTPKLKTSNLVEKRPPEAYSGDM